MFAKKPRHDDDPAAQHDCGCGDAGCTPEGTPAREGDPDETQALIDSLTKERDELKDKWLRALAEYQNFQRRSAQNEQESRRQGVIQVIMSVVPVLDHFDLALAQPVADPAAAPFLEGIRAIRAELIRSLERHDVTTLNPQPSDPFDPNLHSAIMQQPAPGVEPGHISSTLQVGYRLGDRVIRSAKVAVAP